MSTIKANTLLHSDGSTTTQPSIPALDKRMAKAWVAFNSSGTVAIIDSFNVSSITDTGTGYFRCNLSVTQNNANYVIVGGGDGNGSGSAHIMYDSAQGAISTTSFGMRSFDTTNSARDSAYNSVMIFGS
tara:strand:+ start:181 stop:567 length:387 start_codon:yes stop_codon:yes gene_type:complete